MDQDRETDAAEPVDAFGAHITEGVLGEINGREIGPGHVVLSEDRYEWLRRLASLTKAAVEVR